MAWEVAVKAVYNPFMDLKYMVYMLMYVYVHMQSQRTLAVKEEACKESPVVKGVEVMISHGCRALHGAPGRCTRHRT